MLKRVWCYPETMIHLYILGMKEIRGAAREKEAGFQEQEKDKKMTKEMKSSKQKSLSRRIKAGIPRINDIQCF